MAEGYSGLCPICGNKFEVSGTMARCPACGWTDSVKSLEKKERRGMDADSEIAVYRLMSSADAFFSKKSYDEAYIATALFSIWTEAVLKPFSGVS